MSISKGDILTNENRAYDLAKGIVICLTPKPWDYDPIEAYQVRLFI